LFKKIREMIDIDFRHDFSKSKRKRPARVKVSIGSLLVLIVAVGAAGGLLNAFFATGGFEMPSMQSLPNGKWQWDPGFIGNIVVGALAAVILGAIYGPLGDFVLGGPTPPQPALMTLRSFAGAALSGIGGSRLLSQAVDKRYSQATEDNLSQTVQTLSSQEGS
jgi:membrane associated rhomboid family serine protease